ncbi:MAG: adenylate kinase [Actinomycetales bacterium]|nr:MAG: adenylate kinase [Actinomycetales bacterium]
MSKNLVLVGPPGAGKGTQAELLTESLGITHVSTGTIFRDNIKARTELGQLALSYISRGNLVPDEVTDSLVRDCLQQDPMLAGFLLDGYPRTGEQVISLDNMLADMDKTLDAVVQIHIPDEEIVARLLKRAEQEDRMDDTEEVIRHRIEVYHQTTAPLIDIYKQRGILLSVNGLGSVAEVSQRILTALKEFLVSNN